MKDLLLKNRKILINNSIIEMLIISLFSIILVFTEIDKLLIIVSFIIISITIIPIAYKYNEDNE